MTLRMLYIIFQLIGTAILVGELLYVLCQKSSNLQRDLIIILTSLIFAFIAYIVELQATNVETALVGCLLAYLGKPFAFLTTFYLLLDYSHIKVNKYITFGVILYFIVLTVIVFTTPSSRLYYSSIGFDEEGLSNGSRLLIGHGPFWYVYMVSSFLLYGGYVAIIFYEFKNAKNKQVKQMTMLLFFMMSFSILGLALFIFKLTAGYDTTLFGTMIGSIFLLILLVKYKIFDSLTLAKENVLNSSDNEMVVLDAKFNIAYFTDNAKLFVPEIKEHNNHETENRIIDALDKFDTNKPIFVLDKVYKFQSMEYYNSDHTIVYGKSYNFKDVTDEYYYQEHLKNDIKLATNRITQIQKDLLVSIADIVEARDGCTGKHVKNVSYIAGLIARELAKDEKYKDYLNEDMIELIEECMPLHDIGKIQIPDAILSKPGKLTKEEFDIMKKHTIYGADIIENSISNVEKSEKIDIARKIAIGHHEWVDGNGYPFKLKGDEIPLVARIAAVADCYDALRMVRPYKDAFSKEKSLEIIKEETGTHFDKEVVDAFFRIVDSVK